MKKPATARFSDREKTEQVGLRIPLSVLERIDRYALLLREETRAELSRTDVALALIRRGLETVEAKRS